MKSLVLSLTSLLALPAFAAPTAATTSALQAAQQALFPATANGAEQTDFYVGTSPAPCAVTAHTGKLGVTAQATSYGAGANGSEADLEATYFSNSAATAATTLTPGQVSVQLSNPYWSGDGKTSGTMWFNFDVGVDAGGAWTSYRSATRQDQTPDGAFQCAVLARRLSLSDSQLGELTEQAFKQDGDEAVTEYEPASCLLSADGAKLNCAVSIPTDYTPDTFTFDVEVSNGQTGKISNTYYEPGC